MRNAEKDNTQDYGFRTGVSKRLNLFWQMEMNLYMILIVAWMFVLRFSGIGILKQDINCDRNREKQKTSALRCISNRSETVLFQAFMQCWMFYNVLLIMHKEGKTRKGRRLATIAIVCETNVKPKVVSICSWTANETLLFCDYWLFVATFAIQGDLWGESWLLSVSK